MVVKDPPPIQAAKADKTEHLELIASDGQPFYALFVRGERVYLQSLADRVGIDRTFATKLFSPRYDRKPTLSVAYRLAQALGVTMEELYEFLKILGKPL